MKYSPITVAVLLLLSGCSIDHSPNYNSNESNGFIKADHNGCSGLAKTNDDSYLEDYYYNKDTLYLRIHFTANCYPEFVDSAVVTSQQITLFVKDTLANCRCICPYVDDFKFMYADESTTNLEFWQAGLRGEYVLGFETTF